MEFSKWSIWKAKVSSKKQQSLDALEASLRRAWDRIPQTHVRAACGAFITRLDNVVRTKGHIEQLVEIHEIHSISNVF